MSGRSVCRLQKIGRLIVPGAIAFMLLSCSGPAVSGEQSLEVTYKLDDTSTTETIIVSFSNMRCSRSNGVIYGTAADENGEQPSPTDWPLNVGARENEDDDSTGEALSVQVTDSYRFITTKNIPYSDGVFSFSELSGGLQEIPGDGAVIGTATVTGTLTCPEIKGQDE